ncbi:hypothetical protein BLA60_11955 [Actinophytocola xinjiangensis]|uniref:PPE domain-containing protein n=1 Tax=Actinophytocola xinjiangensis TaxID=485602 RepID=A0A7Z1AYG1_9PSEU|nr:hypothetical protein BLA60_11955 [Actinophytocola xinjiangensis]
MLGYRWEGYDHQTLYDMVRLGAVGSAVIDSAEPAWAEVVTMLGESGDRLDRLQREVGVSWEGRAAGAMAGSVSPLSAWVWDTSAAAGRTNASLTQIADGFSRTSYSMPEPVAVPSRDGGIAGDFAGIVAGMADEDSAEFQARDAKQLAVDLMHAYAANNDDSVATAGTFTEPPSISTGGQELAGAGGRGGGVVDGPTASGEPSGHPYRSDEPNGSGSAGRSDNPGRTTAAESTGSDGGGPGTIGRPGDVDLPGAGSAVEPRDPSTEPASTTAQNYPPTRSIPGAPPAASPFPPVTGVLSDPGRPGPVGGPGVGPGMGPGTTSGGNTPRTSPHGAGFGPLGTGKSHEDREHTSPDYLRAPHEDFWDDHPPVAPPVIGVDE